MGDSFILLNCHPECYAYAVAAVPGTNVFIGAVNASCPPANIFCPCSVVSGNRKCIYCDNGDGVGSGGIVATGGCECPCECPMVPKPMCTVGSRKLRYIIYSYSNFHSVRLREIRSVGLKYAWHFIGISRKGTKLKGFVVKKSHLSCMESCYSDIYLWKSIQSQRQQIWSTLSNPSRENTITSQA